MTQEKHIVGGSGWFHLCLTIGMMIVAPIIFMLSVATAPILLLIAIPLFVVSLIWCNGFFTIQPNESCLMTFFGPYMGLFVRQAFIG